MPSGDHSSGCLSSRTDGQAAGAAALSRAFCSSNGGDSAPVVRFGWETPLAIFLSVVSHVRPAEIRLTSSFKIYRFPQGSLQKSTQDLFACMSRYAVPWLEGLMEDCICVANIQLAHEIVP